mmetsp:Transcript_22950/g.47165  ORF Transcript_22950/g.47165 Transcript_22950/m.47165 type:complete len:210 (+) Transcript_22950:125-754(+)
MVASQKVERMYNIPRRSSTIRHCRLHLALPFIKIPRWIYHCPCSEIILPISTQVYQGANSRNNPSGDNLRSPHHHDVQEPSLWLASLSHVQGVRQTIRRTLILLRLRPDGILMRHKFGLGLLLKLLLHRLVRLGDVPQIVLRGRLVELHFVLRFEIGDGAEIPEDGVLGGVLLVKAVFGALSGDVLEPGGGGRVSGSHDDDVWFVVSID